MYSTYKVDVNISQHINLFLKYRDSEYVWNLAFLLTGCMLLSKRQKAILYKQKYETMERRNYAVVITQILAEIPTEKIEFIEALKRDLVNASYKAPELTVQWQRTMQTLQGYIPQPKEDWEFKVLHIFTTRTIEQLKVIFNNQKNLKE